MKDLRVQDVIILLIILALLAVGEYFLVKQAAYDGARQFFQEEQGPKLLIG